MIVTVEPGCYFIPFVLETAFNNPEQAVFLNIEKLRGMYGFGGVRIEDDVLILADGIENLSAAAPRTIEDIEAWLAK
jgi:Xaa-Pro dipeptidase